MTRRWIDTIGAAPWAAGLAALTLASIAASAWAKLTVGAGSPFWLDEAWTGAIIGQPTWAAFWRQLYWDVNAPLYYVLMHVWQMGFGLSDAALRLPSIGFSLAAPLIPLLWRAEGLTYADRLTWAGLIALWFPGLAFAQEARAYALLLLLSTAQAVAYLRLLARPDVGRAAVWSGISALAILTHYDALAGAAIQGLLYLAVHRMRAVRTWPAALAFVPAFAWLGAHLPRITEYLRPDVAWYGVLPPRYIPTVASFLVGSPDILKALAAVLVVAGVVFGLALKGGAPEQPVERRLWVLPLAAALGAAELLIAGCLRPSFTIRYLTPFAPGALLGFALGARLLAGRRAALVQIALLAVMLGFGRQMIADRSWISPKVYNFEIASGVLKRSAPRRLVFFWDHPVGQVMRPQQLEALGAFFFRRDGLTLPVIPIAVPPGQDANPRLSSAGSPPGSALLWVYDVQVGGTSAIAYPPRLSALDPSWRCRQFGAGRFGVLACQRATDAPQTGGRS